MKQDYVPCLNMEQFAGVVGSYLTLIIASSLSILN